MLVILFQVKCVAPSHDVLVPAHGSAKVSTSGLALSFVVGWVRVTTHPSVDLGGIMHNKFMIIDGKLLFTGSYNWSGSAETSNYENALFLTGATTIQKYQTEFDRLWGN